MPAATMFSKFKSGTAAPQNPIDSNPISQYFEIGRQTAAAGPELVWKIYEAYKKCDGKVISISIPFPFSATPLASHTRKLPATKPHGKL